MFHWAFSHVFFHLGERGRRGPALMNHSPPTLMLNRYEVCNIRSACICYMFEQLLDRIMYLCLQWALKIRSHQRTWIGDCTDIGFTSCVHIRLVYLWTLGKMRCGRSAFWTKNTVNNYFTQQSKFRLIACTVDRVRSETLLNPPRLGCIEFRPNPDQIQSAYVHTGGLAIQVQSKFSPSPLVWTHL